MTVATFHAMGVRPCCVDILNKIQREEHNSGNFLRNIGGLPSGPQAYELLDSMSTRLTSSTDNTGVGIIDSVRLLKTGILPSLCVYTL